MARPWVLSSLAHWSRTLCRGSKTSDQNRPFYKPTHSPVCFCRTLRRLALAPSSHLLQGTVRAHDRRRLPSRRDLPSAHFRCTHRTHVLHSTARRSRSPIAQRCLPCRAHTNGRGSVSLAAIHSVESHPYRSRSIQRQHVINRAPEQFLQRSPWRFDREKPRNTGFAAVLNALASTAKGTYHYNASVIPLFTIRQPHRRQFLGILTADLRNLSRVRLKAAQQL